MAATTAIAGLHRLPGLNAKTDPFHVLDDLTLHLTLQRLPPSALLACLSVSHLSRTRTLYWILRVLKPTSLEAWTSHSFRTLSRVTASPCATTFAVLHAHEWIYINGYLVWTAIEDGLTSSSPSQVVLRCHDLHAPKSFTTTLFGEDFFASTKQPYDTLFHERWEEVYQPDYRKNSRKPAPVMYKFEKNIETGEIVMLMNVFIENWLISSTCPDFCFVFSIPELRLLTYHTDIVKGCPETRDPMAKNARLQLGGGRLGLAWPAPRASMPQPAVMELGRHDSGMCCRFDPPFAFAMVDRGFSLKGKLLTMRVHHDSLEREIVTPLTPDLSTIDLALSNIGIRGNGLRLDRRVKTIYSDRCEYREGSKTAVMFLAIAPGLVTGRRGLSVARLLSTWDLPLSHSHRYWDESYEIVFEFYGERLSEYKILVFPAGASWYMGTVRGPLYHPGPPAHEDYYGAKIFIEENDPSKWDAAPQSPSVPTAQLGLWGYKLKEVVKVPSLSGLKEVEVMEPQAVRFIKDWQPQLGPPDEQDSGDLRHDGTTRGGYFPPCCEWLESPPKDYAAVRGLEILERNEGEVVVVGREHPSDEDASVIPVWRFGFGRGPRV